VGVVADAPLQPRWLVEAIAKVAAADFAELAWVGVENGARSTSPRAKAARAPSSGSGQTLFWSLYRALDRKLFAAGGWSQPVDVTSLLPPARRGIEREPVDVVVALGDVADERIAPLASHGVWRYCFGPERSLRESDAAIREVLEGADVTCCGLRIYRRGHGSRLAYESWSRTLALSVARNRDNLFAKSTEFLARALRALHRDGPASLDSMEVVPDAPARPLVGDGVLMVARLAGRAVEKAAMVEQWGLAFRFVDIEPWSGSLAGFHRLDPPRAGFWADPFALQRGGKSYIFFEELPGGSDRAHISVIEVDRDGRASKPLRVLEREYHLSYPFLVEDGGQLYMVPETAGNRTIEIYRCIDFPGKWRRERVLVDGIFAADATLHHADGRWWMFANVSANGAEVHDELHVFTSERLLGDWKPIARDPVKSDVRCARPAGRLFTQAGRLYRPAQICAPLYGAGVALQRVTRLDERGFAEQEERRILPADGEGVLGLHTINRAGDLSVTDAFVRRSRLSRAA
jgi:hypothetical protein